MTYFNNNTLSNQGKSFMDDYIHGDISDMGAVVSISLELQDAIDLEIQRLKQLKVQAKQTVVENILALPNASRYVSIRWDNIKMDFGTDQQKEMITMKREGKRGRDPRKVVKQSIRNDYSSYCNFQRKSGKTPISLDDFIEKYHSIDG